MFAMAMAGRFVLPVYLPGRFVALKNPLADLREHKN
jgi:hypothetical protein